VVPKHISQGCNHISVFSNSLGTDAFMVLKHCIKVRIQLGFKANSFFKAAEVLIEFFVVRWFYNKHVKRQIVYNKTIQGKYPTFD
jgi:hypothetical protein